MNNKIKRILTIQDLSCVGQCSLTVALPIISSFGTETCVLPSAVLSTHTGGFSGFTFRDLTEDFPSIIEHWKKENIKFGGFYTGYIANAKQIDYILEIFNALGEDGAVKIIDPAMADFGKMYKGFGDAFVKQMSRLVERADYVLPNITEAALLTGNEYREYGHGKDYVLKLCEGLVGLGAKYVVLKGIRFDEEIGIATFDGKEIRFHTHERINKNMHGTGDVYASCFVGALTKGYSPEDAAKMAADFTLSAIKQTIPDSEHWYGVNFEQILKGRV